MKRKLAASPAATAVIVTLMAAGPAPAAAAQAGADVAHVPCDVSALAGAMSSASSGETLSLAAGCVYVLAESLPAVGQALTIEGHGATLERSYAPGTAAFTILRVDGGAVAVSRLNFRNGHRAITVTGLSQLAVNGGTFIGNTATDGGAIYSSIANGINYPPINDPQVNGATFTGNTATDGGAIYSDAGNGISAPAVNGATFTGNTAADGGAIYNYSPYGNVAVSHSAFRQNTAGAGGAIWEYGQGGTTAMTSSTFRGNTAGFGGALALSENDQEGFSDVVIRGNSASGDGGGVYCPGGGGGVILTDSKVDGNHAGGNGGGLYDDCGFGSEMTGTGIQGNSATDGGGIYSSDQVGTVFTDSTISGNHAAAYGGGIYNQGMLSAAGTQIVRNRAASAGGGIYDDGADASATLTKSAVSGNQPDNCEPPGSITGCTG